MSNDPIQEAIFDQAPKGLFGDEQEPQPDGLYGEGTHQGVALTDVETFAKSEKGFGYRVGLIVNLKPGLSQPMVYHAKFDLPVTREANGHDIEQWQLDKETKKLKFLNDALQAIGCKRPVTCNVDLEEQYAAIVNIFRNAIGSTFDMKVAPDGKNVKDPDATSGWRFEPNGYSKVAWIKASRKKRG